MSDAILHFPRAEYEERIAKTRAAMAARGIDVILVSDPSNMCWLTGYDGWSFYVHQGVLLGLEGEPVWWGRAMDGNGAKRTVFIAHDNIVGYPDHYVQSTERHPMDHLSEVIAARGWDKANRLQFEMDNYWFTAAAYASLQQHLPNARFSAMRSRAGELATVGEERQRDRRSCAGRRGSSKAMHAQIVELAEPGLEKHKLVAEIQRTAILGADGHWGDYCAFRADAAVWHGRDGTASDMGRSAVQGTGESTFFEIGGCYRRYHCPQSRTLFLGKPPQKYHRCGKSCAGCC